MTFYRKLILRRLLKKPSPERYTISLPEKEQRDYDYISVLGATAEHADTYIRSWDDSKDIVYYMWWPEGAAGERGNDATCKFADLKWDTLHVRHRYRTWEIRHKKASEAFWHDILRLPFWKWWWQKIRNKLLRPVTPDYRMRLLKQIVEMHSKAQPITISTLLVDIHGSAIRLSSDYHLHQTQLEFLIMSLTESGDLLKTEEGSIAAALGEVEVAPAPKAALTIAEFNESARRHKDIVLLTRGQLLLGFAMLAIAAVTLFVELRE